MDWLKVVQVAINYIEANITEDIGNDSVAKYIHVSDHNFPKYFSIITGCTLSEYIRNRRMFLAGEELSRGNSKVIDVAMKYRYDSPESFSKAYTRFHGCTPSETGILGMAIKYFEPLTINITLKGGFTMTRKLIDNAVAIYINPTENYMLNSCMNAAMLALGENKQFDFLYFAGACGDIFTHIWNEPKWQYNDSFSNTCQKTQIPIKAVFDACGYEYEYITEMEIKTDKEKIIKKIVSSIDKGLPVLTFGIVGPPTCSIICGYENDGDVLIGRAQFDDKQMEDRPMDYEFAQGYFQKCNGLDESKGVVFFGKKKEEPNISEVYIKSINNILKLATLPADGNILFGKSAIDAWADSLLCDNEFTKENLEHPLDTYGGCMVMVGTNMYNIQTYLDRSLEYCLDMKEKIIMLKEAFNKEQEVLNEIVEYQGGYFFDKDRTILLNKSFRDELANKIRRLGDTYFVEVTL